MITNDNWFMKYLMSMMDGLRFHISFQLIFVKWFAMYVFECLSSEE